MRKSLYDHCTEHDQTELLSQWDEAANLPLTPQTVSYGSKQKVAWRCGKGHEWRAQVCARTGSHSGCPVCAGLSIIPGENDLQTLFPEVAAEWHPLRNADATPETVGAFTHRRVWWRCGGCGHEWLAEVRSRTSGSGCPVCAGRTVRQGVNDLASRFPLLASELHPDKNAVFRAGDISPGSRKKVWWQCSDCGRPYLASIASRTQGSGCPVCAGKTVIPGANDLGSRFPEIAREWDAAKNAPLTPDAVTGQSNRKVWWRCALGHSYQAAVASRTAERKGCPFCAGKRVLPGFNDLASLLPAVAAQWHPTRNGTLTAEDVTCGSGKRVWWQCNVCGYEWKAIIYSRAGAQRCGCPDCAGKVKRRNEERYRILASEQPRSAFIRQLTSGSDPP